MVPSNGTNVSRSREREKALEEPAAPTESASERERDPDPRVSQSPLITPTYDFGQTPLTSTTSRQPAFLTETGPPPPPRPLISPAYPGVAQTPQPFPSPWPSQTTQQQALAFPMQSWQAQPPYNCWQPYPGSNNMPYPGPWAGYTPVMSAFSSLNQHLNPLPIEGYAPNPAIEPNLGGNQQGQFDTWNAIRNQQTSTRSSYAHSNMASNLGRPHTSATSQSQPEAFESENQDALLRGLYNAGFPDLGPFPPTGYSNPTPSFGHGEDGDEEGEQQIPPEC
ncbi:hypothetical protein PV04_00898 [Phialophora macrospora]|uniref:Uncharacterized protein n=1 Tax=Phialophora macrospora TaxID=1851006 RepID=A0A0D2EEJ8_9EURO|nr:hypothetical protein PV04_00898 [Phialophora macrospora]